MSPGTDQCTDQHHKAFEELQSNLCLVFLSSLLDGKTFPKQPTLYSRLIMAYRVGKEQEAINCLAGLILSLNNSNTYFRASLCRAPDCSFHALGSLSPYNKPAPYLVLPSMMVLSTHSYCWLSMRNNGQLSVTIKSDAIRHSTGFTISTMCHQHSFCLKGSFCLCALPQEAWQQGTGGRRERLHLTLSLH